MIVDRVVVDLEDLARLDDHAAIPAAEPLVALYRHTTTSVQRRLTVHGFTADGRALVLDSSSGRLVRTWEAAGDGERLVAVLPRDRAHETPAVGPFTPAPPGLTAVFTGGRQVPVLFYDLYGRPAVIDGEEKGRCLYLATEDEALERIVYHHDSAAPGADTTDR